LSKKKFTTGLESLFGDSSEKAFKEESPFLDVEDKKEKRVERSRRRSTVATGDTKAAKRASKNFTSDLETLFEQALSDTIEEQRKRVAQKDEVKQRVQKRRIRRPLSGLDALIRRTGDMEYVEVNTPTKKRVTFVLDKNKVEKLKGIARTKKSYLKDIIGDVVTKFIERYEQETGEKFA
jgi:predicted Zn-dependent protease